MRTAQRIDAETARDRFGELVDAASEGRSTIIMRLGRPVAALVPLGAYRAAGRQQKLTTVKGSGRGLWSGNSARTLRGLCGEWDR